MKEIWIAPEKLFDGQSILSGHAVRIVDDTIAEIAPAPRGAFAISGCLTPGFVDLQVNGGGGVLLNATPTVEAMETILSAHHQFGTAAILPTVITDRPEVLDQAAEAALAVKDDGIIGLHIEGPHISVVRRGTHRKDDVRPFDGRTMDVVARLRKRGVSVMITVAPEAISLDDIARLSGLGAIVSIGHTDALAEEVEAALAAGASCGTHLFNAMSPMTSRAPGAVGALINSHALCGIICDGHHVDDRMIRLAIRARPEPDLMFAVSDAMPTVGGPPKFELYGADIQLEDGRLVNAEGGLAGAQITQFGNAQRLVNTIGIALEEALRMVITTPARAINRPQLAQLVGRKTRHVALIATDLRQLTMLEDALVATLTPDAAEWVV
ncbi:MAG: amidohydrolase family protein [Pseudomonadota bacterium]